MLTLSAGKADYRAAVAALALSTEQKIGNVLEQVGVETVDWLRSLTNEMRPPARGGEGPRPAHPGGWADITGQLANGYTYRVERIDGGFRLVLENPVEYAGHLEAREGYFVLGGIADPGGPVWDALRQVAADLAPEWTVTAT